MNDKINQFLGLSPIEVIDGVTGEITEYHEPNTEVVEHDPVDETFEEASRDAQMVRGNIKDLITRGFEMFDDVSSVAKNTQNPDQYQAAARFYSELIKANKELMNIHRDVFAMKPPAPKTVDDKPSSVTNVLITTNSEDFLDRIKAALEAKKGSEA